MTHPDTSAVARLRDALRELRLEGAGAEEATAVADQLDDYILPRLTNIDAPLLAVVGGSTGSGKSTLVNAVLGEQVTNPGVIRPTTRQPILVVNPADADWFGSSQVLPGLARSHGAGDEQSTTLRVVSTAAVPEGLALLDAPDFDSIDDRNRALSSQLLAAADLWLFVTTPARYADNLVWNFLHDAAGRDIEVAVVLNRLDADAAETVPDDLQRMMAQAGLGGAGLFRVPFIPGLEANLPQEAIDPLREYLHKLAKDTAARRQVAGKTVAGALEAVAGRVLKLAQIREDREAFAKQLAAAIDEHYAAAVAHVGDATSDGKLLRTEVLDRWQDFVGTSDLFRGVEKWFSRTVDRLGSALSGRPTPVREVETQLETGLHAVIVDAADTAATRSWSHLGAVAPDVRAAAAPSLSRASADISEKASALVRAWQEDLLNHIQETAGQKRQRARIMSLGLNVATVALMLVVFASTAGLTGGEVAIAGGSAVVGQKLLETIFGEDTVRRMAARAREDLDARLNALYAAERDRFDPIFDELNAGISAADLRESAKRALVGGATKGPDDGAV
ncbi:ABC transporter [Corynebacterium mayonis]|uniref:ABC transporter n=1 Tax=Corynebacterium mayonis TaxID=3062461 RepID=UPI0031409895